MTLSSHVQAFARELETAYSSPDVIERHKIFPAIRAELVRAVLAVPEEHAHSEKVEREFEERILAWEKGKRTKERWAELEFKTVGRKCKGKLVQISEPKVVVEWDTDLIGWKIIATVTYRCFAAKNYGFDPDVIQYSMRKVSQLDLR